MNLKRLAGGILVIICSWALLFGGSGVPGVFPDPKPAPVMEGDRVLIIYESEDLDQYPSKQRLIWQSSEFRGWLTQKTQENRIWDKDTDLTFVDDVWRKGMTAPRSGLPWIIVTNGKTGFSGPLPEDIDSTKELIEKYL